MKCDSCGLESDWDRAFRPTWKAFLSFQKPLHFCPGCWEKRQAVASRWAFLFAVAGAVLSILVGVTIAKPGDRRNMLALGCLIFFLPLSIVLHELAHAFTEVALGLRLFVVSYGLSGRVLYRRRFRDWTLEIRRSLSGGFALAAPRSTRWLRLRWSLVVAAAPLANALLAAAAFVAAPKFPSIEGMLQSFAWANLILLVVSLFPWKYATPFGVSPSDGLALLTISFASSKMLQKRHAAYFALEGMDCLRMKDPEGAEAWARKGLREYPGEVSNRSVLGVALLALERLDEARSLFLELAASDEPLANEPQNKAIFLNNVAWADLLTGDGNLLEEADQYSQQAMRLTPWVASIKGTRGSVLVTLGRLDEGIRLLEQAFEEHDEKDNKAANACFLSVGFKKAGNLAASQRFLETARTLDPECQLIPRALEEFGEPSTLCVVAP
jgi:tetratricopeptide (TPR) repeat protein